MTEGFRYIDTPEALRQLARELQACDWLALDTEFMRESTYYPKLCLLQLATAGIQACIDPLAVDDLGPLFELIYQPRITKVFHAARQDLEIFYHLHGAPPAPVFDTQLAAPLLGHAEQIGYGNLVAAELGITLDKNHARADWTRRPLPKAQLRYAMDDVIYLARLYPRMRQKLQQQQRLAWLDKAFAQLSASDQYHNPPEHAWRRIRAAKRLKPRQLAVLQHLAAWREQQAQALDRPRNWICRDEVLVDLARLRPGSREELAHIRALPDKLLARHGDTLIALIRQAQGKPPPRQTQEAAREPLPPQQQAVVDSLMAIVTLRAAEHAINPASLASRKDVEALVSGAGAPSLLQGWRKSLIGEELQAMLQGRRSLQIEHGRLRITALKNQA